MCRVCTVVYLVLFSLSVSLVSFSCCVITAAAAVMSLHVVTVYADSSLYMQPLQRVHDRLNKLTLLARHGDAYRQAKIAAGPGRSQRASSVPPNLSSSYGCENEYSPKSYAVRMAGNVCGPSDWPAPRVIRNTMPSVDASLIRAKTAAKVHSQLSAD